MKMTFELSIADIEKAIKAYVAKEHKFFGDKVSFNVSDTSDDRFGGTNYELTSATISGNAGGITT